MSNSFELKEEDAFKFLASGTHLGTTNVDHQMKSYMFKRRADGVYIINLKHTWEKLQLAARALAAIEDPADIVVVSARPYAHRALTKFATHTGATPIFGRFAPGALTNQIQKNFKEPRVIVISDPQIDHQVVTEASYANVPVICFANSDSPLKLVDIAIPCNNKGAQSLGLMWWFLARELLILKGQISRIGGFFYNNQEVMPDLYFYREPTEIENEIQEEKLPEHRDEMQQPDVGAIDFQNAMIIENWAEESAPNPQEWGTATVTNQWATTEKW